MDITAFTFNNISVSWDKGEVAIAEEGRGLIETTAENMTEICIQWLALHDPKVLKEDEE